MCEMLGLNFSRPVEVAFSFAGLLKGSERNPHGWGVGCYPDGGRAANIFKEAKPGYESLLAAFLSSHLPLRSSTFLAHIRKASRGSVTFANCHPFSRHYKALEYLFVHNGTMNKELLKSKGRYRPLGQTDSELAFCSLMGRIEALKIYPVIKGKYVGYTQEQFDAIYKILREINQAGSLACILTDGQTMFAYRDANGLRELHYQERHQSLVEHELGDEEVTIKLPGNNEHDGTGFIMATVPIDSGEWKTFQPGQMIVCRNGAMIANISG